MNPSQNLIVLETLPPRLPQLPLDLRLRVRQQLLASAVLSSNGYYGGLSAGRKIVRPLSRTSYGTHGTHMEDQ